MSNAESQQQAVSLTVQQALIQAIAHHRQGQAQDAERLYRTILQSHPNHPDANHNLGVLAMQAKQPTAGLPHFRAALQANPNQGQYWLSYIDALIQAGQTDAARQVVEQGQRRGLQGEVLEALAGRLARGARPAEQSNADQHLLKESLAASSAVSKSHKKRLKTKPTKPDKSAGQSASHKERDPGSQEINILVALFAEGRYTEAASLAQKMTVRFPLNAIGWKMLGLTFSQLGRSADALAPMQNAAALSPGDAVAHCNLGSTLQDMGRLEEAEASYRRALQIKPDFAEAHYNLGSTLKNLRRLVEAEASYRQALAIRPDFAEAHYNLGNALKDLGRMDEVEACYRRALQIKPDFAEAYYNLGITLNNLGRLVEAEASFRRALAIRPDFAEAHYSLGNALRDLGRMDEVEASYQRALEIKPDFAEALNAHAVFFLGHYQAMHDVVTALNSIVRSLQIEESREAKSLFVQCVKHISFDQVNKVFRDLMVRAVSEPWGRPVDLAPSAINMVKLDPDIGECVARAARAWPQQLDAQALYGPGGFTAVNADDLLCGLLNSAPACDIEMERFLTMARRAMLEAATGMTASVDELGTALDFYSALACQCFINEYVFSHTDDEIRKASGLRDSLLAALDAKAQVPAIWPVAVAAYFPLCSLPLAARLFDTQWPEAVTAVLRQQLREPEEELQLRTTIPRLTEIDDEVSLLVQSQYEENPYPRWVKAAPAGKTDDVVGYLCQKFPLTSFDRHGKSGNIDVLIAGCGTGQHSIHTAQKFPGARALAVDLSLSSLSYAMRKTRELGFTSIDYAHADLLKLGSLGRSFDVIESVGVLHHLADPWTGWQVLLSLLRPGGFMRLGFYSEMARRNIVTIRDFIAAQGYGSTPNEIRKCRQDLVDLDKGRKFGNILKSPDFFSISACRDLLFHVQEHRMTLAGIAEFFRVNSLTFLGFSINDDVLHSYKRRFPDDRAASNLDHWQVFENENPDTFLGMYDFWIQKAV